MNSLLEFEILRAKSVGQDSIGARRNADQQRVSIEPMREPRFELHLPAALVQQVAVIIEDRAVADHVRRMRGGFEFMGDADQADDVTLLVVHWLGPEAPATLSAP